RIQQVDVKGEVSDAQRRVNGFHGGAAHDFTRALGVLDVHPEERFDSQVEATAGKTAQAGLSLVQNRTGQPTRANHTIGSVDQLDQCVEGLRRRRSVGIDVTDNISGRRELESFNEGTTFADRIREVQGADERVTCRNALDGPQGVVATTIEHNY